MSSALMRCAPEKQTTKIWRRYAQPSSSMTAGSKGQSRLFSADHAHVGASPIALVSVAIVCYTHRAALPAPSTQKFEEYQTDRQTDRQFGRKTHSEQLGCCATHLRRHNSAPWQHHTARPTRPHRRRPPPPPYFRRPKSYTSSDSYYLGFTRIDIEIEKRAAKTTDNPDKQQIAI
eukprot:scaffold18245_cov72-Phaeocystis_antarctica.AAC.2